MGRGPPPVAHRLGHARLPRTCFTMPTNVSCTPAPVFALAYDHGQPRSRKNDSTSAGGRARPLSGSALFTTPYVGVSPATERMDRAHSSSALSVSRRVRAATATIPLAPWEYAPFSNSPAVDGPNAHHRV